MRSPTSVVKYYFMMRFLGFSRRQALKDTLTMGWRRF